MSLNALIIQYLPESYRPGNYDGTFKDVKDYLDVAFSKALEHIRVDIPFMELEDLLIGLVRRLGDPDPIRRCRDDEQQFQSTQSQLEKAISSLNYACAQAELLIHRNNKNESDR